MGDRDENVSRAHQDARDAARKMYRMETLSHLTVTKRYLTTAQLESAAERADALLASLMDKIQTLPPETQASVLRVLANTISTGEPIEVERIMGAVPARGAVAPQPTRGSTSAGFLPPDTGVARAASWYQPVLVGGLVVLVGAAVVVSLPEDAVVLGLAAAGRAAWSAGRAAVCLIRPRMIDPVEVPEAFRLPKAKGWRRAEVLKEHFDNHGADFGFRSAEEYAEGSVKFLERAQREHLPTKVDGDGVIRIYDPATNTFASYNPDGTTKTFFKPDPAMRRGNLTNLEYWTSQKGVDPWNP